MTTQIAIGSVDLRMALTSGGHATNTFTVPVLVDNQSLSPYGTGWTSGGLQQIAIGISGQTLMITDVNGQPEEFTSTSGSTDTGAPNDSSTLTHSSTAGLYLRTYHDGTTISFNGSGQEISTSKVLCEKLKRLADETKK